MESPKELIDRVINEGGQPMMPRKLVKKLKGKVASEKDDGSETVFVIDFADKKAASEFEKAARKEYATAADIKTKGTKVTLSMEQ